MTSLSLVLFFFLLLLILLLLSSITSSSCSHSLSSDQLCLVSTVLRFFPTLVVKISAVHLPSHFFLAPIIQNRATICQPITNNDCPWEYWSASKLKDWPLTSSCQNLFWSLLICLISVTWLQNFSSFIEECEVLLFSFCLEIKILGYSSWGISLLKVWSRSCLF